jgi:hypothetical protein
MNGFTYNNRTKTRIRNISVAICVSALLAMPVPASAGVFDAVKSRVDSIYSQVRSIRAQMGALISGMNETRDALRGEGARLMLNSVRSMLVFLQESQEQYRNFSGPNDCDAGSPCSEYRESLHGLINDIIVLPSELPFVEDAPSLGSRLTNATQVIDIVPTFVLYASEQMIGDAVADVRELTGTLRSVAAQLPEIPTLERLDTMSDAAFDEVCEVIDDNPHIALLGVVLDNTAGLLDDTAGFMQDNITVGVTAVGGGAASVKNPVKANFQLFAFALKTWKRNLDFKVALVTSACALP